MIRQVGDTLFWSLLPLTFPLSIQIPAMDPDTLSITFSDPLSSLFKVLCVQIVPNSKTG